MFKKLPDINTLNALFEYKDGALFWKIRPAHRVQVGDRADSIHKITKYRSVSVNQERYQAHRVIWKLLNNEDPNGEIDHINGNRSDNRIENLRVVNKSTNLKNQKKYKNNKSGTPGVYWSKQKKKWCVQVTNEGVQRYYGCYINLEDAIKARKSAEKEFEFHDNHGRK